MKREIKFRAWDGIRMTTSGIMFNSSTGCLEVPTQQSINAKPLPENKTWHLMQSTGLCDKNGKEIYEGDIVKGLFDGDIAVEHIAQIIFSTGAFVDSYYGVTLDNHKGNLSIIGNIHSNPELINQ